jgi:FkbM family methyltransferase
MRLVEGLRTTARLAPLVRERARFTRRQLAPGPSMGRYRIAGGDVVVHLRHHTPDIAAFEQAFFEQQTTMPAPVLTALRALGRPPRVADLGANIGLFGAHLLRTFPDAAIAFYEPDPANLELLRATAAANGGDRHAIVAACAADADGELRFSAGNFTNSRVEPDGSGITVPAVDVFPRLADIDLLKVDIEGGEWALLADRRFIELDVAAISLEYHAHMAPPGDPAEHVRGVLREGGYESVDAPIASAPGHGMVWAWKARAGHAFARTRS